MHMGMELHERVRGRGTQRQSKEIWNTTVGKKQKKNKKAGFD